MFVGKNRVRGHRANLEMKQCKFMRHRQWALFFAFLVVGVWLVPGCRVNRTLFQMDSDGRTPALGIDLIPIRSSLESPSINEATYEGVAPADEGGVEDDQPLGFPSLIPVKGGLKPRRIPLPRTDLGNKGKDAGEPLQAVHSLRTVDS